VQGGGGYGKTQERGAPTMASRNRGRCFFREKYIKEEEGAEEEGVWDTRALMSFALSEVGEDQ